MDSVILNSRRSVTGTTKAYRPVRRQFVSVLRALAVLGVAAAATPTRAVGQSPQVGDALANYIRMLQVDGLIKAPSFFLRPLTADVIPDSVGPWAGHFGAAPEYGFGAARVALDPARLRVSDNSSLPFGQNDDAMWQGRGVNFALDGGATGHWGALSVTIHPTLVWSQNQAFPLAPVIPAGASPYAYPWRVVDLPQRYGPHAYSRVDPGQSNVALTGHGVRVSFGTESMWWGPGINTSIVMSDNAPGFPHLSLATSHPANIGIGTVEAQWIWGRLQESDWYSGPDAGVSRLYTGAVAAFSPSWSFFKGLTVGGARSFVRNVPPGGLSLSDYFTVIQPFSIKSYAVGNYEDDRDQITSFLFRWQLPTSGFEMYGEWARNDHGKIPLDILLVPQHSQGYTLGFQKVQSLSGGNLVALNGELTHLELDNTAQRWPDPSYYAHNNQGNTQFGQLIGSAVGPGGDGEHIGVDLYSRQGQFGLFVMRQVHDNDAFYTRSVADTLLGPDVTLGFGGRAMVFTHGLEVELDAAITGEADRYFIKDNGVWNTHAGVTVRWRPGTHRR